jgi:hypothetical protein
VRCEEVYDQIFGEFLDVFSDYFGEHVFEFAEEVIDSCLELETSSYLRQKRDELVSILAKEVCGWILLRILKGDFVENKEDKVIWISEVVKTFVDAGIGRDVISKLVGLDVRFVEKLSLVV